LAADALAAAASTKNTMVGLSFAVGFGEFFQILSALNSSPWTMESFAGDPAKLASAKGYVVQSVIVANVAFGFSAWLQRSPWILLGSATASGYAWWLYGRAARRGKAAGSEGWGSGVDTSLKGASWTRP
jgi:hypothetical protein